ncbi:hypothetical protein BGZ76_001616 [Entomortierella beljakovae]|nr:hypothetical protein BGZ76_001616 [Entomortierella beljakovae]
MYYVSFDGYVTALGSRECWEYVENRTMIDAISDISATTVNNQDANAHEDNSAVLETVEQLENIALEQEREIVEAPSNINPADALEEINDNLDSPSDGTKNTSTWPFSTSALPSTSALSNTSALPKEENMEKDENESEDDDTPSPTPDRIYNIILLGQTQSGKSTFLQAIRRYADPLSEVDLESIGNGNSSHTNEVTEHIIETDFPIYKLIGRMEAGRFDPRNFIPSGDDRDRELDISDYTSLDYSQFKKKIRQVNGLEVIKRDHLYAEKTKIRIFDTPGLDDTNGYDVRNVAKILSALSDAGHVNLVVITISRQVPMSKGLRDTLKDYTNIFSEFRGLITFIHTKSDLSGQHRDSPKLKSFLDGRDADIMDIMGRRVPQFLIDCDFDDDGDDGFPVHMFFRQQTIYSILRQLRINVPVSLKRMQIHKTIRMGSIDSVIIDRFRKQLDDVQAQIVKLNNDIASCDRDILDANFKSRELKEYINNHDTDGLELLHEDRFSEDWAYFSFRKESELKSPTLKHNIDEVRDDHTNIEIKGTYGGVGSNVWGATIIRNFYAKGSFHVKLYVKKRNMYQDEIRLKSLLLEELERDLKRFYSARRKLESDDTSNDGQFTTERKRIQDEQSKCLDMITRSERQTLSLNLFKAMANEGLYEGEVVDCADKVIEFYSKYVPEEDEEATLGDESFYTDM